MEFGSLAWAEATDGRLTPTDRRRFLGPALRQTVAYTVGRMRLWLGLRGEGGVDLDALSWPDSRLAQAAEAEAADVLTPMMHGHSVRTFLFGLALAQLDDVDVDIEHLYVTSLLHDIALESASPHACFAVRGGRRMRDVALGAGADPAVADQLAQGIANHITPGVDAQQGPLAPLLQFGAMVDLTGDRLWDLAPGFVQEVFARHPRQDLRRALPAAWKAEGRTFPEGRARFLESVFRFSWLVRFAPHWEAD